MCVSFCIRSVSFNTHSENLIGLPCLSKCEFSDNIPDMPIQSLVQIQMYHYHSKRSDVSQVTALKPG